MKLDRLLKKLPQGFVEEADKWSEKRLKEEILLCEGGISGVEMARDADTALAEAKEMVKELAAPYQEDIKAYSAKIDYVMFRLREMGKPLEPGE